MTRTIPCALIAVICIPLVLGQPVTTIVLYADGSASVEHKVAVNYPRLVRIKLLGDPIYLLVLSGDGRPLPFNKSGLDLTVEVIDEVVVSYDVEGLARETEGIWSLDVKGLYGETIVVLPNGSVLVYFEPPPEYLEAYDSGLKLVFNSSYVVLEYFVYEEEEEKRPLLNVLWLAAVAVTITFVAVYIWRRLWKKPQLTEEEKAILSFLKSRGGWAYQAEIREFLGLPTTTVWRRVKRLEELGLVSVEKTPRGNKVKIKHKMALFHSFP